MSHFFIWISKLFYSQQPKYIIAYINAFDLVLPFAKCIHNSERKIEICLFVATFTYAKVSIKNNQRKFDEITGQTKG